MVYVVSPSALAKITGDSAGITVMTEMHQSVGADLRGQVECLARERGVVTEFLVIQGDPFTGLRRVAEEKRADALVVGASEQAGHRFMGSLAGRLVKAARWPVTVVP